MKKIKTATEWEAHYAKKRLADLRATCLYGRVMTPCYKALLGTKEDDVIESALRISREIIDGAVVKLTPEFIEEVLEQSAIDVLRSLKNGGFLSDGTEDDASDMVHELDMYEAA